MISFYKSLKRVGYSGLRVPYDGFYIQSPKKVGLLGYRQPFLITLLYRLGLLIMISFYKSPKRVGLFGYR